MNNDIEQLKKDIQEFEIFKESILRQQVTFPLDKKSYDVVHVDLIVPTGVVVYPVTPNVVPDSFSQEATVNGKRYLLNFTS